ncbi:hypothetical protein [Compostibacter hankyongensis]|uniref:hypothetical protein n=1 Tax=Compostibacter hankyongensis TaxID=1007089 RepID=UPI0031EACFEB
MLPINWKRFDKPIREHKDMMQSRQILGNAARYNLVWIGNAFKTDSLRHLYIIDKYNENGVRPAASACYGLAVALKCAALDDESLGASRATAFGRVRMLLKGVAAAYKANRSDGKGWGNDWQTAFWATLAGQGAWMLWDDLDVSTRQMVQKMVIDEADRFIAPGYKVPYWTSPDGHVNSPGDTKAEENAWNANILQLAVAMMPRHAHVERWKRVCSELMLSAFSIKKDLQNNEKVDGRPVKEWLHGFNVRDDGAVINHHIVHPDYTMTITLSARAFLTQSLAEQPVSQAAEWNAAFVYHSLMNHRWPSPPYKAPGGTMYIPGKAGVYYPQGTDWSKYRFDIYYLTDVDAYLLDWDKRSGHSATEWMRLRSARILAMQGRHKDGHMFTYEEYPTYPGREQMVVWQAADAYLLFWLNAHHAIARTREGGRTWLSPTPQ